LEKSVVAKLLLREKKRLDTYIRPNTAGFRLLPDDGMTATFWNS